MDIHQILLKYWGYNSFRPLQEDIINSVLEGKDTLALLPTGGGKSICFQVPALAKEGICIVVSPLIALMKDQVENLKKRGVKAEAVFSGMTKREIDIVLDNCVYGNIKFLYVSPERVETEIFKARYEKMNVNLIAVDESHCISQWGYDFRPSYLNIAHLREAKPELPILALTATATPEVVKDIQHQLKFSTENVMQKSFERKNLAYAVLQEEDKLGRLLKILNKVPGTSVVYVRSRKRTKEIANFLLKNGVSADYYHAGLSNEERAGRDEKKAFAVLLVDEADRLDLTQRIIESFPEIDTIKQVYQALANFFQLPIGSGFNESYDFNIIEFSNQYNFKVNTVFNCLKFLEKEGYIYLSEATFNPSKIKFELKKSELYEFQVKTPHYDLLIKTILRSYGGVFENFVKIDETELAQRLKTDKSKIEEGLNYLNTLKVITFIPQTNQPQLTYLTERLENKNLVISAQHYHERKEIAIKKMESVIYYAASKHKCRSEILLNYFGQKDTYRCGVCDVCLERNKLELSDIEFSAVSDQLKKSLHDNPLPMTELVNSVKDVRDDKIIKVIQRLIENEKIKPNNDNLLEWKK